MEPIKFKHLIGGKGDKQINIPLTINFIPILITFNYNLEKSPFWSGTYAYVEPTWIHYLYNKDAFQGLLDIVCKEIGIEKKELKTDMPENRRENNFKWTKDSVVKEFLFQGGFQREYYIETELRHALLFHEKYELYKANSFDFKIAFDKIEEKDIIRRFDFLFRHNFEKLSKQKVFSSKRDMYELSHETVNNFLKNLKTTKSNNYGNIKNRQTDKKYNS